MSIIFYFEKHKFLSIAKNLIAIIHCCRVFSSIFSKATSKTQDFLEANPYWDQTNIPLQLFKAKEPHIGKVVSVKRIVGAQATGETCNIIIDHQGSFVSPPSLS